MPTLELAESPPPPLPAGLSRSLRGAFLQAPSAGGGASTLAPCVVAGGEAEAVLKALMASEVLCRSIDQITPYDRSACVAHSRPSAEADAAAVVTALPATQPSTSPGHASVTRPRRIQCRRCHATASPAAGRSFG